MISRVKIEPLADEGFYQTIEPQAARHQFNMSLGLVSLMTLIALAVGATVGFAPLASSSQSAREALIVVQAPQRVRIMQAQADSPASRV